jgi:hypothetical protein
MRAGSEVREQGSLTGSFLAAALPAAHITRLRAPGWRAVTAPVRRTRSHAASDGSK